MLEEQERNRLGCDLIEVELGCLCCFERSWLISSFQFESILGHPIADSLSVL